MDSIAPTGFHYGDINDIFQETVHSENWLLPHFCLGSDRLLYTKSGHHCINAQLCPALHRAGSMPALPHSIGSLQFRMADMIPLPQGPAPRSQGRVNPYRTLSGDITVHRKKKILFVRLKKKPCLHSLLFDFSGPYPLPCAACPHGWLHRYTNLAASFIDMPKQGKYSD